MMGKKFPINLNIVWVLKTIYRFFCYLFIVFLVAFSLLIVGLDKSVGGAFISAGIAKSSVLGWVM